MRETKNIAVDLRKHYFEKIQKLYNKKVEVYFEREEIRGVLISILPSPFQLLLEINGKYVIVNNFYRVVEL